MAIKKSDLYASIWASCDELRGGMDASQYKDYVLFMLFIKYISDSRRLTLPGAFRAACEISSMCMPARWTMRAAF